jgi:hypothetical protein
MRQKLAFVRGGASGSKAPPKMALAIRRSLSEGGEQHYPRDYQERAAFGIEIIAWVFFIQVRWQVLYLLSKSLVGLLSSKS